MFLVAANLGNTPLDLGGRSAPLFLSDMGVAVLIALGGVAAVRARSFVLNDVAFAAIAFAAIGALSAVVSMSTYGLDAFDVLASLAYLARWLMYFALYLVVINFVDNDKTWSVWRALELAMLVFAAFGIIQSIFLPDFGPMLRPDDKLYAQIDPQGHRLVSTVLEPNIAAAMILVVLLVQLAQIAYGVRISWWKPSILFAALVLTMSRSGALGFFFGVLLIVSARGVGKRMLRFGGLAAVVALAALPSVLAFSQLHSRFGVSDGSAAARLITWQRAIELWQENPWFGIGFNTYGFVQESRGFERFGSATYSAEGGLLFIGVMTGLVGLAIYGTMVWFVLRRCRASWRSALARPEERAICLGAAAASVAIIVHSTFVNSLLVNFVMEELWVVWALAFISASAIRQRSPQPRMT
jgi:hypothetical protein